MCSADLQASGKNCPTEFATGTNDAVGTYYPMMHQLTFSEGIAQMKKDGLTEPAMTLSRASAAGGWRPGANWDGDTACQVAPHLSPDPQRVGGGSGARALGD